MKPLEIFCRNRVMYAQITVHDKSMGMKDYHLYNKNGLAHYVFRKSQGELDILEHIDPSKSN
ncbi:MULTISPECIES: hypothetical protein [Sphingobacterium]|uniref:hypothetical protein n=1 Tax=Sphingobacterium TaxID=28453 RepID=UPI00259A1C13|nr:MULTISPECIES: hypothetical protein [Sphingobacterium]